MYGSQKNKPIFYDLCFFSVGRKNHLKIPLDSLKTVELSSIPHSKPPKMSLTPLCVWAPQLSLFALKTLSNYSNIFA